MKKLISTVFIAVFSLLFTLPVQTAAKETGALPIYTLTQPTIGNSTVKAYMIDQKFAYAIDGGMVLKEDNMPQYFKYGDFLTSEKDYISMPGNVDKGTIYSLLTLGYPLDLLQLREKHGISEAQSYLMTQNALWVILEKKNFSEILETITDENSKAYIKELINLCYAKEEYSDKITFSSSVLSFTEKNGEYVSQQITVDSPLGGIFRVTNLPEGFHVLNSEGVEVTDIKVGSSFLIKTNSLNNKNLTLKLEYIHSKPIVLYYEVIQNTGSPEGSYQNLLTADFADEDVEQISQQYLFTMNPNTSDGGPDFYLYAALALLGFSVIFGIHKSHKEL